MAIAVGLVGCSLKQTAKGQGINAGFLSASLPHTYLVQRSHLATIQRHVGKKKDINIYLGVKKIHYIFFDCIELLIKGV